MSDDRFRVAMRFLATWEGWVSNDPNDRGGLTMAGVTQETYDRARKLWNLAVRPVTQSTAHERERIYLDLYWTAGGCPKLPPPLDLVYFDAVVQHGRAPWLLQEAVGAKPDGKIGPETIRLATTGDPRANAEELLWARLRYYSRIASNEGRNDPEKVFLPGWINRIAALRLEIGGPTRRIA